MLFRLSPRVANAVHVLLPFSGRSKAVAATLLSYSRRNLALVGYLDLIVGNLLKLTHLMFSGLMRKLAHIIVRCIAIF